ncbi:TRAP transporter small permease [Uliginosibacterium sp. 31-12]|uniref:TRAP transporter small permease n=1 Tax=Uliginosibacterium sp. 31-12 TaxID=3062781 RepID=UPI0026E430C2|nr:TRAP transporter small permease [Uliginosibacterium sp. 31-12]MDO6385066.1 TRAP transporter small permease [Uliginosibacterium sp. 31-12]
MQSNIEQMRPVERWLGRLCDISASIGGTVLVSMAGMTVASVIGRTFFANPILGDVELVQLGSAVVVASFLPYTQYRRANIIVDFFTTGLSARKQEWLDGLGSLLYTLMLALICWRVAVGCIDIRATGEASMLMNFPLWIAYLLMLPGLALSVLIGLYQTLCQLRGEAGVAA